jgi:hypothetical protein
MNVVAVAIESAEFGLGCCHALYNGGYKGKLRFEGR